MYTYDTRVTGFYTNRNVKPSEPKIITTIDRLLTVRLIPFVVLSDLHFFIYSCFDIISVLPSVQQPGRDQHYSDVNRKLATNIIYLKQFMS